MEKNRIVYLQEAIRSEGNTYMCICDVPVLNDRINLLLQKLNITKEDFSESYQHYLQAGIFLFPEIEVEQLEPKVAYPKVMKEYLEGKKADYFTLNNGTTLSTVKVIKEGNSAIRIKSIPTFNAKLEDLIKVDSNFDEILKEEKKIIYAALSKPAYSA